MNDRPDASNGKRYVLWGTTETCPACGQCLCFGCHPEGPCVDERQAPPETSLSPAYFAIENR